MKRATMAIGVTILAVTTAYAQAPQGQGQGRGRGGRGGAPACTNLACDVQADWARSMNLLVRTAEAMPEDKWNFKTTDPQRTFGQHVMHIVQIDSKLFAALGAKTPAPQINMNATTKADVMAALRQSLEYGQALVKEFDDAGLLERVNGFSSGRARAACASSTSRWRTARTSTASSSCISGSTASFRRPATPRRASPTLVPRHAPSSCRRASVSRTRGGNRGCRP
jgi:hypothetical protein